MTLAETIILGIIEGITEFLPISSTFHLLWSSSLFSIPDSDFMKVFLVVIQSGAICGVVFLYWKELVFDRRIQRFLIFSFIPTAVVGLIAYPLIKGFLFETREVTTAIFTVVGGAFLLLEYAIKQKKLNLRYELDALTIKSALYIGVWQSLAVIPGVSRAGAVLVGMMLLGYKRSQSAKYSFLLSVPTILAASLYDGYKMREVIIGSFSNIFLLLVGISISFLTAIFAVKLLIQFLQKNSLELFGWYRILLGIILLLILFVGGY